MTFNEWLESITDTHVLYEDHYQGAKLGWEAGLVEGARLERERIMEDGLRLQKKF
jgi:hypothetical protein